MGRLRYFGPRGSSSNYSGNHRSEAPMCNLYSMTTTQEAMRRLARVMRDNLGNQPPLPAIFPDQLAPVVRLDGNGERTLDWLRWGFPPPPRLGNRPITNVRNIASPYWRGWLKRGFRCLAPATSFCEHTDTSPKVPHWFALDDTHPLFAFLTTEANEVVRPIHAKAMPVVLTGEAWDVWLEGETEKALELVRPFPEGGLKVVAMGKREDAA